MNNKILISILLSLAVIVAAVWIYDSRKGERSFRSELVEIDPGNVTAISIYPSGASAQEIRLEKVGDTWNVVQGEKTYPADTAYISRIIHSFMEAKPERVAGMDKNSWGEFMVTDTSGTRVVIEEDGDVAADLRVGRVSFSQSQQNQMYGRNQNPDIKSHVRVAGDDKVYLVNGFLSLLFQNHPSAYRNKVICRFDENQPVRFTFTYPGDSSFVLAKTSTGWMVDELPADSLEVISFLRSVAKSSGNDFAPDEVIHGLSFTDRVKIEGDNTEVIDIEGIKADTSNLFYVRSSANPEAVFKFTNPTLYHRIFTSKGKFH
ncbi:MAG: DUF4340 domain-containing protein [Bacteroidales bacterium]|nr:DUF4340 domain-containing protein [Bacteroidales bacterium]